MASGVPIGGDVPRPELVAAWFRLRRLPAEKVPVWAANWIVEGLHGDAVVQLAGLDGRDPQDVEDLLLDVFAELSLREPTVVDAARLAFMDLARHCLNGATSERLVAAAVESIYIESGYDDEILGLPLGQIRGIDDEWSGKWGRTEAELRSAVRGACRAQLTDLASS